VVEAEMCGAFGALEADSEISIKVVIAILTKE
jgi:hypothetical protein